MKRYWLSVFACLCLAMALLPTVALAADEGSEEGETPPVSTECAHENETVSVIPGDKINHAIICANPDCNAQIKTEAHDYVEDEGEDGKKEATCTEDGYIDFICSICHDSKREIISALDHEYDTDDKCTFCGAPKPATPHEHTFVAGTPVPATCTADGYTPYTCACGEGGVDKQNIVKALGHKFGEWKTTKEPTATETGLQERVCSVCQEKETKTLAVTGTTTPTAPAIPADLTLTSPTTGGVGKQVTAAITAGHWLTIQVTRENSIVISSVQAPVGGDGKITFSAASGSKIQVWETAVKMEFNANGAPISPIFSTGKTTL